MSTLVTGLMVAGAFYALGLGPALLLRSWTALPWRFLALLTLMATALSSYAVFWIAFVAPAARIPLTVATLCASAATAVVALRRTGVRALLQPAAWAPACAAVIVTAAYLVVVLVPPGPSVNERLGRMPADNILPGLFAQRVVTGTSTARPVAPLWPGGDRASDRPPLQAALVVTVGALVPGLGPHEYQILGSLCQAQWLPALCLLGAACGMSRRALAGALAMCALSGFFFVHTVFTWPKLLAAALLLGALAIAADATPDARAARARGLVVATLVALSLLAHAGPIFTLIVVPLLWPWLRPAIHLRPSLPAAVAAGALAVIIGLPWLAYQAGIDPPSGRLLREHLGDGRRDGSTVEAIVRANLARPIGEQLRVRVGNLTSQMGNPLAVLWPGDVGRARREQFFRHGSALGVLLVGLVAACWRPRPGTADGTVRRFTVGALAALALWSVLLFPAGGAMVHHGSLATTALLVFTSAYGLTRLPSAAAVALSAIHVGTFFFVWILPVWRGPWGAD